MSMPCKSDFHEQLRFLGQQHDNEVAALRSAVEDLRARLPCLAACDTKVAAIDDTFDLDIVPNEHDFLNLYVSPEVAQVARDPSSACKASNIGGSALSCQPWYDAMADSPDSSAASNLGSVIATAPVTENHEPMENTTYGGSQTENMTYGGSQGTTGRESSGIIQQVAPVTLPALRSRNFSVDSLASGNAPALSQSLSQTILKKGYSVRPELREEARPAGESGFDSVVDMSRASQARKSVASLMGPSRSMMSMYHTHSGDWKKIFNIPTIHPSSLFAAIWNVLAFIVLLWDVLFIPMQVFDLPESTFLAVIGWSTQIFWNLELILSFFTGYYQNGEAVVKLRLTILHYLRTWFVFDFLIVALDWLIFVAGQGQEGNNSAGLSDFGKNLRMLKFLRVVRVLKMAKLKDVAEAMEDFLSSDILVHFTIVKLIAFLLMLNHFVACIWYGIGDTDIGDGWVQRDNVSTFHWFHRYISSYHWALTQLGVGTSRHVAFTAVELVFTNCNLVCGIMVFSGVISIVTSSVSSLHEQRAYQNRQFRLFRRFCKENSFPHQLARRVKRYLQYISENKGRKVLQHEVTMFESLSQQLLEEISEHTYTICLKGNKFITRVQAIAPDVVRKIANRVIFLISFGKEDLVFSPGQLADKAMVLVSGNMKYSRRNADGRRVEHRQWICEASLWLHRFLHLGTLRADQETEVLGIGCTSFMETIGMNIMAWDCGRNYAEKFCRRFNRQDPDDLFQIDSSNSTRYTSVIPSRFTNYDLKIDMKEEDDSWIAVQMKRLIRLLSCSFRR